MEEANNTLMPIDYSGVLGHMYSIVGEGNTSMSTQVKLVVIGDEASGKNYLMDKFFENKTMKTDSSTDEKFKHIEI